MIHLNDRPVPVTVFPDNTSQVWKLPDTLLQRLPNNQNHEILWTHPLEQELMQIAQLKELLDRYSLDSELHVPYLPYARQDKMVSNSACFALFTFARILNSLRFKKVRVLDVHSSLAHVIHNLDVYYPTDAWLSALNDMDSPLLCFPDDGACRKYENKFHWTANRAVASKTRDQLTGNITNMELTGAAVEGRNVLVVDDICDGGATFIILAQALKKAGAKSMHLFVSHGIFSRGVKCLYQIGYQRVLTPNGEVPYTYGYNGFDGVT